MIGTLQSSNFFALKESALKAFNRADEAPESIGGATATIGYGFAAPGDTEAVGIGFFGAYSIVPLQLDLPDAETYIWTLDPSGQDLLGLSMTSGGEVSGDITDSIEHLYTDFDNYLKPSLGELPPNGELHGYFDGQLVIHLRVQASGIGSLAGYYESLLLIYPLAYIVGSLTYPDEFGSTVEAYEAKQYPDATNTAEGVGFGVSDAIPIYLPGSSGNVFPIVERVAGSGWRMRVIDINGIEYASGFSATPFDTFNVTRTTPGYTNGGGTFAVSQA